MEFGHNSCYMQTNVKLAAVPTLTADIHAYIQSLSRICLHEN